ncbi:hypothetical protein ACP70R_010104 [Stipagrostis hirtigluma subsp. patula]
MTGHLGGESSLGEFTLGLEHILPAEEAIPAFDAACNVVRDEALLPMMQMATPKMYFEAMRAASVTMNLASWMAERSFDETRRQLHDALRGPDPAEVESAVANERKEWEGRVATLEGQLRDRQAELDGARARCAELEKLDAIRLMKRVESLELQLKEERGAQAEAAKETEASRVAADGLRSELSSLESQGRAAADVLRAGLLRLGVEPAPTPLPEEGTGALLSWVASAAAALGEGGLAFGDVCAQVAWRGVMGALARSGCAHLGRDFATAVSALPSVLPDFSKMVEEVAKASSTFLKKFWKEPGRRLALEKAREQAQKARESSMPGASGGSGRGGDASALDATAEASEGADPSRTSSRQV